MNSPYQMCTRCVMDTTDAYIIFNSDGVCNHCIAAEKKLILNWFPNELGLKKLEKTSTQIRDYGKNREYDCIIGMSGGVDSSYLLHVAIKMMNLRPLVVHVDAGWNSPIAVQNIEKMVKALGLDLFTYVVNWHEIKDLQLAFLKSSVANQDTPQDHAFFAKVYDYAIKNKIKYVLTGSNLTSESILPRSWGYNSKDRTHLLDIHKRFGTIKLKTFPTMSFFLKNFYWPYVKRMKIVTPLNWINYNKIEAIDFLTKNYDWKYYGGKHQESFWTKFFQSYYLPLKFGYDKRKAHLSSLIMANQVTREEALKEIKTIPYNELEIEQDMVYVSKKLGISVEELKKLMSLKNKTYRDYRNEEGLDRFIAKLGKIKRLITK